ncbi:MAG TPA: hypothetical protein VH092_16610 [Urbifossiella sp.]|nr:hypothetical protein [Urbifossiella sp.]
MPCLKAFGQSGLLGLLADALGGAGCADQVVLGHLRKPDLHVPGGWAVDLVLGKP